MEVKREAQLKHRSAILPPLTHTHRHISSSELPLQMQRGVFHHHCFIEDITFISQIVSITDKTSSVGNPHVTKLMR